MPNEGPVVVSGTWWRVGEILTSDHWRWVVLLEAHLTLISLEERRGETARDSGQKLLIPT